jgi:hypothetical protein
MDGSTDPTDWEMKWDVAGEDIDQLFESTLEVMTASTAAELEELKGKRNKSAWAASIAKQLRGWKGELGHVQQRQLFRVKLFDRSGPEAEALLRTHGKVCVIELLPLGADQVTAAWVLEALTHRGAPTAQRVLHVEDWGTAMPRMSADLPARSPVGFKVVACGGAGTHGGTGICSAVKLAAAAACSMLFGIAELPDRMTRVLWQNSSGKSSSHCKLLFQNVGATKGAATPAAGMELARLFDSKGKMLGSKPRQ